MTSQEKIQQLAMAALRSAPEPAAPQPATYMTAFDRPAPVQAPTAAAQQQPVQAAAAPAPAPAPAVVEGTIPAAAPASDVPLMFEHGPDLELSGVIEERDNRMAAKRKRQNITVSIGVAAVLAATVTWYFSSPSAQAAVASIMPALRSSAKDVKSLGTITKQYDEQLKKVAARSTQITDATKAMGVDPNSVNPNDDPNMEGEMKKIMGDERNTADRNRDLQQKFGFVRKIAGREAQEKAAEMTGGLPQPKDGAPAPK